MSRRREREWTGWEDELLRRFMALHGPDQWRMAPSSTGLRKDPLSCRERWLMYLSPDIKRGEITPEEEDKMAEWHRVYGDSWWHISAKLPGRTPTELKRHWNSTLRPKLIAQGIDVRFPGHTNTTRAPSPSPSSGAAAAAPAMPPEQAATSSSAAAAAHASAPPMPPEQSSSADGHQGTSHPTAD